MPGLDLRHQEEERRARDLRARPRLTPRASVQTVADAHPHELVPGWVELDLVDAIAEAVVRS